MKPKSTLVLSTLAAVTFFGSTSIVNAQGFSFRDFLGGLIGGNEAPASSRGIRQHQPRNNSIYQNVYALDQMSHTMYSNYGWEVRRHPGCPKVRALYTQMKSHSASCDGLVRAFQGTCPKTFKKAACAVNDSAKKLVTLRSGLEVSGPVSGLIQQTSHKANFVHNNTALFRPVLPAPRVDPVWSQVLTNMNVLPNYSNQLVNTYSREAHCGCKNTQALLTGIRDYNTKMVALQRAQKGTCPKTFKKSACDARTSLTNVQNLRKKVTVSDRVCSLIRQSCPKLTYVHNNSSHFQPFVTQAGSCSVSTNRRGGYSSTGW